MLINQDFNAAFYAGTNATNLSLVGLFLLADGTAHSDNVFCGPGFFLDPTGWSRQITNLSGSALFQIQAWLGNYTN